MVLTDAEILEIKSELERVKKTSELDEEHMKVSFHFSSPLTVVFLHTNAYSVFFFKLRI